MKWFTLDTGRPDLDAEVDEEIRFHFETTIAELMASGMDEAAARAEAERRFGSRARYRDRMLEQDASREGKVRRRERLEALWQDARLAVRSLAREPGLVLTIVLLMGLGIGANATMVGLVDRLLFRPPAHVADAGRVVQLSLTEKHPIFGTFTNTGLAWPDYLLARGTAGFGHTGAFYTTPLVLGRGAEARLVTVTAATASFFPLLGAQPLSGRFFTEEEDRIGAGSPVVVISERFWRRHFGGSPAALGTSLQLGSTLFTVIGVAPGGFTGIELNAVDAWVPLAAGAPEMLGPSTEWSGTRNWQWVRVIARLRPDARPEAVQPELTSRYKVEIASDPGLNQDAHFGLHPVIAGRSPEAPRSTRVAIWLSAVSFAMLLITCANVANLLLARGARREREIAVRMALGSRRRRLVFNLLLEAVFLAGMGAALALLLSHWGGLAIRRFLMPDIDWSGPPLDGRVLAIALIATLMTVLLAGLVPALQTSRPDLTGSLKAGSQGAGRSRGHARLRRSLLVFQTALSVLLLVGAGLFVRSLNRVVNLDLGFDPSGLLVASVETRGSDLTRQQRAALVERIHREALTFPGVASSSIGISVPFQTRYSTRLRLPGRDTVPVLPTGSPNFSAVSPEFFATTGIRILRGRAFTPADGETSPPVMLVNQTMAKTYWPGEEALGKCVLIGGDSLPPCAEVVGVVNDANTQELKQEPTMQFYVPVKQAERLNLSTDRNLFFRVAGNPEQMVQPIRRAIIQAAPEVSWASVRSMESLLQPHMQPWRLGASMFGIFGLLAALVAAVGLYGVLAYSVATRTREFGIRGALGASTGTITSQILREGVRLTALGLAIGLLLALGGSRWVASLLFETSPRDPLVLGSVGLVLLMTAVVASLLPARRAARVAPAEALRGE
jgi:putative ABC transport system permease protein